MQNLMFDELRSLLDSVFRLRPQEGALAILVDQPDARVPDHEAWQDRRRLADEWFNELVAHQRELPFSSILYCAYRNVGSNNNDLPGETVVAATAADHAALPAGRSMTFAEIFERATVVLAPTQLSATAPLKLLARQYHFRGATLPGFSRAMLPVLALDYERVNARVLQFKERLDRADGMSLSLEANGELFESWFDLRFRTGHASGGLMREDGMVGNLPSGEAYIVPYEGECAGEPSRTSGQLPVQFGNELVVYRLERNTAVEVLTSGPVSAAERQRLEQEPAYGNMAEVGLGVLGEWGVQAVGSTLLDEKLGLHIAFGRSDHFGGITSPAKWRDPEQVVHIDRVYVPAMQPRVQVREAAFAYPDGSRETFLRNGVYVV